MSRRKPDAFERAAKALGRVGRTREGRKWLKELGHEHGETMAYLLGGLVGKP